MNTKAKLEKWHEAQKRHGLSNRHVQMARELGLNPNKLGKIDNHEQELWKVPLPQFIENIYCKRFKKSEPTDVKSIDELLANEAVKRESHKKSIERKRKEAGTVIDGNNLYADTGMEAGASAEHISVAQKLKLYVKIDAVRIKLESGDTYEAILRKEAHIFDEAFDFCGTGSATLSLLGFILKKIHPPYKPRRYGCKTLSEVFEKLDRYEIVQTENGEVVVRKQ